MTSLNEITRSVVEHGPILEPNHYTVSVSAYAKRFMLDTATVRRMCAAGRIDATKPFGTHWKIHEKELALQCKILV